MATFKAMIRESMQREDKTWTVFIRFTHERKTRYISTSMVATKKDLTASMKIKNYQILDHCDELIRHYRKIISGLFLEVSNMDIDDIVKRLKKKEGYQNKIDFVEFCKNWCISHQEIKGVKNYMSAVNSLCAFFGKDHILCNEITSKSLKSFEEYLSGKKRAQSLYTSAILKLFNEAREHYNDEENGVIQIKHTITKYKPARQNVAEKRSLSVEHIRKIFSLPYIESTVKGIQCRRDLSLDCFKLSFCLMGMNSADLYNADNFDGKYITYYRTKTKDRRNDRAKMVVQVHPRILPLIEKYKGKDHVFDFYERFSSMVNLNRAINIGLKEIGKEIGVEKLQFYSARHSFASIAANEVGIDRWTVNLMLNHTDSSMRVTELYIKKDFNPLNEANRKVIDYVLYGKR